MISALNPAAARDKSEADFFFFFLAGLLALLTLARLVALRFSIVDLYFDESQYWDWARELAFGYYSKPPLLAWIIAGAQRVCGSGESCLRSISPLFHFGTSLLIYAIGRALYSRTAGFWAAILFALMPGIVFSSRVVSTDVPLLFFWALALLAYVQLVRNPSTLWTITLGIALGFGLLAKYSMAYFPLCVACAALAAPETQRWLRTPSPWIALGIGLMMLAPNLAWNVNHGFVTLLHVGHNIRGSGFQFSALKLAEFAAGQFAAAGPVLFIALLVLIARLVRGKLEERDRLMLAFVVPVLVLVTATAFITRANANWTAVIYVAGAIVTAARFAQEDRRAPLATAVCIGLFAQGAFFLSDAEAYGVRIPGLRRSDVYRDTLGWRALGEETARIAKEANAPSIVSESRREIASLSYYLRAEPVRVFAWPGGPVPTDHFQFVRPLTAQATEPVLLVTPCASAARLETAFERVENADHVAVSTGPGSARGYWFFVLRGPQKALAPLPACPH